MYVRLYVVHTCINTAHTYTYKSADTNLAQLGLGGFEPEHGALRLGLLCVDMHWVFEFARLCLDASTVRLQWIVYYALNNA